MKNTLDNPKYSGLDLGDEMVGLFHTIDSFQSLHDHKMIQFIASHEGEGVNTIVREFAKVSSQYFGKSVLLLETNGHQSTNDMNVVKNENYLQSIIAGRIVLESLFEVTDDRSYRVCSIAKLGTSLSVIFSSSYIDDFINLLKSKFDIIVLGAPPACVSPDGIAVARKIDGVVLVIEAENTRWPVAESVKDKIEKVGGMVIGAILNKQKYYIPRFIYNLL